jgi:hypothetical protein
MPDAIHLSSYVTAAVTAVTSEQHFKDSRELLLDV